jgi:phospholipid/cholesterol/gamma-HCH transport system permease protein
LENYHISIEGEDKGNITLSFSGYVSLENLNTMMSEIHSVFEEKHPSELTLDLARVEYMDSAGALLLIEIENEAKMKSIPFTLIHMSEKEEGIMNLLDLDALKAQPLITEKQHLGIIGRIGKASLSIFSDLGSVISFTGELIWDTVFALRHPFSIRWGEVLLYMKRVGVDGLPILGLISFLLGLIMAFMSSLQLKQLGANVYVASLVSIAMVRELGPIMTAIVVAGRSGSAFAAEIGTMKVNEEVDALITMGFNPIQFLAIPKVFAAMFVVPLLTLFADIFAIAGGMVVGVLGLNLTLHTYIQQTFRALDLFNMIAGIIKSVVFGIVIAGIGCQRGFQVRGGAEEVGVATTSAVVSALFLIIVIDSVFAIVLYYI